MTTHAKYQLRRMTPHGLQVGTSAASPWTAFPIRPVIQVLVSGSRPRWRLDGIGMAFRPPSTCSVTIVDHHFRGVPMRSFSKTAPHGRSFLRRVCAVNLVWEIIAY